MHLLVVFSSIVAVVFAQCPNEQCGQPTYSVLLENNGPSCNSLRSNLLPLNQGQVFASPSIGSAIQTVRSAPQSAQYQVSLDNCGPRSRPLRPVNVPSVSTRPIEAKPVVLPFKVPSPKTVSNRCRCEKVILKPQVVEQVVVVPVIRKYVQTLSRPAFETINYSAIPINCPKIEAYC